MDRDADVDEVFLFRVLGGIVLLEFVGESGGGVSALGHPLAIQVAPGCAELVGGDGEAADGVGSGGEDEGAEGIGRRGGFIDGDAEPEALLVGRGGGGIVRIDADDEGLGGEVPALGGDGPVEELLEEDVVDFGVGLEMADLLDIGHAEGGAVLHGDLAEQSGRGGGGDRERQQEGRQQGQVQRHSVGMHVFSLAGCAPHPAGAGGMQGLCRKAGIHAFPGLREVCPCLRRGGGLRIDGWASEMG